jgi:iron(III) transport system ATP-binding protein
MVLHIRDLHHAYKDQKVLQGIDMTLKRGQIACLLGPSGCGKTTLLRCIAGFEVPESGAIAIAGEAVYEGRARLATPPNKRKVGVVFQDYALFPHLSVEDNIAFGIRHLPLKARREKVKGLLNSVDMIAYAKKMPAELSGGQQQRVAIARALAPEPELLLLDEPFSNLDPGLKERMKHELLALLRFFGVTALMVTHNQDEAFDIADEIGVMADGKMLQWGSAYDLYHKPRTKIVAEFLGTGSFLPARVTDQGCLISELGELVCEDDLKYLAGQSVSVLLRPDDIIHDDNAEPIATLEKIAFRGMYQVYHLKLASGQQLHCFTSSHHHAHDIGTKLGIRLDVKHAVIVRDNAEVLVEIDQKLDTSHGS